jgi:hypothetical protein
VQSSVPSGLISLPRLDGDAALIAAVIVALLTVVVAGRSVLAWQALSARAAAARQRADLLDRGEERLRARFEAVRAGAAVVNAATERALWQLPHIDDRVAGLRAALADDRQMLEVLRRDDASALAARIGRVLGTLSLLRRVRDLRRTIWG